MEGDRVIECLGCGNQILFTILERIGDPLVRVLVIVVAVTATRIGEALGLMWSDIDWKKLKINIRRDWVDGKLGRPKSRASKALFRLSWKWRKRSSVKITERTYEEGTEAFHSRRKSSHPEAASCGQSARLGAV